MSDFYDGDNIRFYEDFVANTSFPDKADFDF